MKTPLISVPLLAYNHEKYVAEAIQSVLEQTFPDFELIIIDDGSTDGTDEIIRSFRDSRIVYRPQSNQGPAIAVNNAIEAASGKYIAIVCGDDAWYPNRLQRHYESLQNSKYHWGFSWVDVMDEDGHVVQGRHLFKDLYDRGPLSRAEIIRASFFDGCPLHTNTAMVERELYLQAGLFHVTAIQAHDFDMWIRLLIHHAPLILPERLVKYRVRSNLQNLSSSAHSGRTWFELYQLHRTFFNEMPCDLFRQVFADKLRNCDFQGELEYELEKAFLYLQHKTSLIRSLGNEKLFCLLRDPEVRAVAETRYSFGLRELYGLNQEVDLTNSREYQQLEEGYKQVLQAKERCDNVIAAQERELQVLREARERSLATIAAQERELQIFRASKLQRLRSAILYDRLSMRKVMKIAYLTVALVIPKPIRTWFRPAVQKWRHRVDNVTQRRPKIKKVKNEEWPKDRPLISIVIPCFNYGRYVEEAVDSVLSQTFQDFEIIVVDGGSTDSATLEVMRSFQKPKTKVYLREGRHLVGDNRNFGIEQSKGKYICCLDADDKLKPTYLEKALFLLEAYNYDIVSTSVQTFGESNFLFEIPVKPSLDQITKWNQISTVAVFSKNVWDKARGYHDWGLGKDYVSEDWDLWVRMMALGARARNISEPLMLYRKHQCETLSTHSEAPSFEVQAAEIRKFNQKYLSLRNYRLSAKRNAAIIESENPFTNLVTSYAKEPRKPSILLALPFVITGGADAVFLGMTEHLVANGFSLSVITTVPTDASFGDNTAKYEATTKHIYHLYRFLEDERQWKDFLFSLIESRDLSIMLLAGSSYVYGLLPEIKQKFPRLKVVDHLLNEFGHIENNRKYASFIDAHIVVNEVIRGVLINRFGESEDKIRVVAPGVDVLEKFNPENLGDDGTALSSVFPQGKFLVSFIGRFSEEKRPEQFVEMAYLLRDKTNLRFLMLGDGPQYRMVKEKIAALRLEDRIHAPGNVSDVRPYLRISGVVVIPSVIEGLPVTLIESLALGVPVIASAVGGIPSVIRDGFNGFVCQPSDIEGFVEKIKRVASDPTLYRAMKLNAREYALHHLGMANTNRAYSDLFWEILGGRHCQTEAFADAQSNG